MNPILSALSRWLVTALIVVGAIVVAMGLWRRYETDPWTRDGHVRADVVRVASDVGGLVTSVAVHDNELVHKGDLLFVIDAPRYADALGQADANIASVRAKYVQAQKVARRDLALGDLVATETHEENVAQVETAKAALDAALAARQTAELNVHRTAVHASVNGIVTNLDLHPGDFVGAGVQALALIDQDSIRVEGYFEETKLGKIHVGDHARIRLMGDDQDIAGHVESITAGIADDQSKNTPDQLRAVDPTFSWVRLAQRIPVRIRVDRMPAGTQLIVGRTATVTILPEKSAQR
jgi:multidrug resistance efflux pump